MHALRKKCTCPRACAPMQRCRNFFARETIANLSWVLHKHHAGCHLPPTLLLSRWNQSSDAVCSRHPSKSTLVMKRLLLRCRTSIIRSSAFVHVSSSLFLVRIRNVATGLSSSKYLFSPFFRASFSSHCSQSCHPPRHGYWSWRHFSSLCARWIATRGRSQWKRIFPLHRVTKRILDTFIVSSSHFMACRQLPVRGYDYEHFPEKRRLRNCGFRKEYVASRCWRLPNSTRCAHRWFCHRLRQSASPRYFPKESFGGIRGHIWKTLETLPWMWNCQWPRRRHHYFLSKALRQRDFAIVWILGNFTEQHTYETQHSPFKRWLWAQPQTWLVPPPSWHCTHPWFSSYYGPPWLEIYEDWPVL